MTDQTPPPDQPPVQTGSARAVSGPSVHRSEIDPALQDLALARFRDLLKGNGINPEKIKISKFSGETLEFLSILKMVLKTKIATRRQAGKLTGPVVVGGPQDMQTHIEKEQFKITHSQDVIMRIKDVVLERKDIGIGLENELMRMQFLHKDFVYYEPCNPCHGQGNILCPRCNGKGSENCPRCYASGMETCPACGGRQYILGPNNQNQQCLRCNGSGKTPCSQCHQSKKVQCSGCKGKMKLTCQQCNGHKVISVVGMAEINVEGTYGYDREIMPPNAVAKIDALGPAIRDHAQVSPIKLPQEVENEVMTLPYHIKLPLADLEFTIEKDGFADPATKEKAEDMIIPAALFGYQAVLMAAPPFLEVIMAPGIKDLQAATQRGANVKALLHKAARYKTLKLIIIAAAKLPMKKAIPAVLQKTEIGLSDAGVETLLTFAYEAIKRIAMVPRLIGYVVGGAMALGVLYLYFTGFRNELMTHIQKPMMQHMADALTLALSFSLAYFGGALMAASAKRNGLKGLLPKKKK